MIILRQKIYSDKKDKESSNNAKKKVIGGASIGTGIYIADKIHKSGEISGRVHLYHGTSKEAKKKIQDEGLKSIHALDEFNITRISGIDPGNKPVVYTAKKRTVALGHTIPHLINGDGAGVVKMSIPYDEYKKMKRSYDNPEMAGAKTAKEYAEKIKRGETPNPNDKLVMKSGKNVDKYAKRKWENLSGAEGTGGTRIFEQDISTRRIKGSKNYNKNSIKEVLKYIKNNPKRFAKGAIKGVAAAGLIVGGTKLLTSDKKKTRKGKTSAQ